MTRNRIGIVRRETGECGSAIWFGDGKKQWLLMIADNLFVGERVDVCLEVTSKTALWDLAVVTQIEKLTRLIPLEKEFGASFSLLPSSGTCLVVLELLEPISDLSGTSPFVPISGVPEGTQVRLKSSPYGTVNPALFFGYNSSGILSRELNGALLLDARYLDGMAGGEVCVDNYSLGMIIGTLVKSNGEGRLMVALEWSQLPIPKEFMPKTVEVYDSSDLRCECPYIVNVDCIMESGRRMWGSGVIVKPRIVLTNKHVVSAAKGPIYAGGNRVIDVKEPLKGVDLVILVLKDPLSAHPVKINPYPPKEGSTVQSIGFGLFYPPRSGFKPLKSEGVISRMLYSHENGEFVPAIIICTASCWNGSSGGAVLSNGELIGLMSSNARDKGGEVVPDMSFVIPSAILSRALTAYDTGKSYEMSKGFRLLWRLGTSHRDMRRRLNSKL